MQVFRSNGSDDDLVRSLTSTVEMLPMTLRALSSTANDDTPSSMRRVRASAKGLSPLKKEEISELHAQVDKMLT
jgi:hypothetical protein